ncbi:nitroreductase family protein [Ensifer sp.]|uniref:nitroreductase family protein n=1 Tax=Ensifer sp. TaxID=1872086 RepID=UPI00289F1726|nr:nitroreductase family protein [Ensifer sp.]
MCHPTIGLIEKRVSAPQFDPSHEPTNAEIEDLDRLATRAPVAYNLQNWRLFAPRTSDAKVRLHKLAYGQVKVSEAAVTFIICRQSPDHVTIAARSPAFVEAGHHTSQDTASGWQESVRAQYAEPGAGRDEAICSAPLGAATLMYAAEGVREFGLAQIEMPVMLFAVGRIRQGNWPQKPRRPLSEVLQTS